MCIHCKSYSTYVSISLSPVPDVTVLITTSGSAEVGMSYTLTCTVSGADNLEATFSLEFTGPNSDSGTSTSLQLPLGTLDLNDAGKYTCTATVSSDLLTVNLMLTDTVDVNIPSESLHECCDIDCSLGKLHYWFHIEPTLESKPCLYSTAVI